MAESAYQDLLKDTSESKENGNYFLVTITDLNPNTTYPLQFRWIYKDKRPNQNWSAVKLITTPGESEPNTPSFNSSNVDTTQPEKIIITWNGQSDDSDTLSNYDRVDVYIDGLPFDGTKAAYSFKAPGTAIIPAPAGTYQIVLYAVSKTGKLSPVSAAVTKSVSAIGETVEAPTNPNGFSSRRILAGIEVSWAGTYANGTFTGFEAIKIYAGTSASATSGTYTEVGVLTGNNVKNTIVVPVDGTYVSYGQAVYIHAAAVNKNGTVGTIQANVTNQPLGPGKATDADINDGAVVISKLASDVLTVGNLKAGDINSTSYIRAGTANSARVEISSSTVGSVLPGLTVYASDGTTQLLRAPLTGGLTINGGGTFTGDLSAGSGNSIFKSDSNGIYLGNASYSSAPFSVSRNGIIKAQSGTIGGWTLGSTYLQGNNLKLDTSGIVVGATTSSYLDISPSGIVHRNSNGTATGQFTLTLGPSPTLSISGSISLNASSTIDGTSASTIKSGAASGASALQPDGTLTGNVSGTVGGVAVGTVTNGASKGATALQGGNGVGKNSSNEINQILLNSSGIGIYTATSGTRLQLTNSGLELYNGTTRTVYLNGLNGVGEFTGQITASSFSGGSIEITGGTVLGNDGTESVQSAAFTTVYSRRPPNASPNDPSRGAVSALGLNAVAFISQNTGGWVSNLYPYWGGSADVGAVDYWWRNGRFGGNVFVGYANSNTSLTGSDTFTNSKIVLDKDGPIYANTLGTATTANFITQSGGYLRVNTSSSMRYKENIIDIESAENMNPESLLTLPVRAFKYKSDYLSELDQRSGKMIPGFIAEELESIYPVAVDYNDDGLPERWNTNLIVPALLYLIQKQNNQINSLKDRLDAIDA